MKENPEDRYVDVHGLRLRYFELGDGPAVVFLHGASLGSSADVFTRNLAAFADAGFRAIAFDQPGFGLSDMPADHSVAFRRQSVASFLDALGLSRASLIAHSQAGSMAVQLALAGPAKYAHIVILGTGSLLPPLDDTGEGREAAVQQRLERRMSVQEPTLEDTRKLLEANLFHHQLITPEALELRHARSIGRNFEAFTQRSLASEAPKRAETAPLWKRMLDMQVPLLLIYGRNDRGGAYERAMQLKTMAPGLNLHIVPECKHLVPWDAQEDVARLVVPFLKS